MAQKWESRKLSYIYIFVKQCGGSSRRLLVYKNIFEEDDINLSLVDIRDVQIRTVHNGHGYGHFFFGSWTDMDGHGHMTDRHGHKFDGHGYQKIYDVSVHIPSGY